MRHKSIILFIMIFGVCVFNSPVSANTNARVQFTLFFSANVNGELEACG